MKRLLLGVFCLSVLAASAQVQKSSAKVRTKIVKRSGVTSCNVETPALVSDGSRVSDTIGAGATNYYQVSVLDGHSYAVELQDPDDLNAMMVQLKLVSFSDCATELPNFDVWNMDPALYGQFSGRISWTQSGTLQPAVVTVLNEDPNDSYTYNMRIVDTTLHNPRWSTYSGFITQFGFSNTDPNNAVNGVLTLHVFEDQSTYSVNVTIPAGGQIFEVVPLSNGLQVPPNRSGNATFAYVGPPGVVKADAYFINGNATVIVPSSFEPRNYQP